LEIELVNNPIPIKGIIAPIQKISIPNRKTSEKRMDAIDAKIGAIHGSRK